MSLESSFDIVSKIDLQEADNAVNQAKKIILNRYDLKGSRCQINFDRKENKIELFADDKMKYDAVLDILKERLAARNISLKSLKYEPLENALDGSIKQLILFQMGIPSEEAKNITKIIRDLKLKVQPQIQGEQIRVSGKSKDDLQSVISRLKQHEFSVPLQFANYK